MSIFYQIYRNQRIFHFYVEMKNKFFFFIFAMSLFVASRFLRFRQPQGAHLARFSFSLIPVNIKNDFQTLMLKIHHSFYFLLPLLPECV